MTRRNGFMLLRNTYANPPTGRKDWTIYSSATGEWRVLESFPTREKAAARLKALRRDSQR